MSEANNLPRANKKDWLLSVFFLLQVQGDKNSVKGVLCQIQWPRIYPLLEEMKLHRFTPLEFAYIYDRLNFILTSNYLSPITHPGNHNYSLQKFRDTAPKVFPLIKFAKKYITTKTSFIRFPDLTGCFD